MRFLQINKKHFKRTFVTFVVERNNQRYLNINTMKAIHITKSGGPEVLQLQETPKPQ